MPIGALFLSIRPKYVHRIIEGRKAVDLRRVRPTVSKGDRVIIYCTSPAKAVVAVSTITMVTYLEIDRLWNEVGNDSGVSESEFRNYFDGIEKGAAIHFGSVIELPYPVYLSNLRNIWPDFSPPQSYRYFSEAEVEEITHLINKQSNDSVSQEISKVLTPAKHFRLIYLD